MSAEQDKVGHQATERQAKLSLRVCRDQRIVRLQTCCKPIRECDTAIRLAKPSFCLFPVEDSIEDSIEGTDYELLGIPLNRAISGLKVCSNVEEWPPESLYAAFFCSAACSRKCPHLPQMQWSQGSLSFQQAFDVADLDWTCAMRSQRSGRSRLCSRKPCRLP